MSFSGLRYLRRAAIVLPLAYTGAWLGYYAYTDTLRRSHIRQRNKELAKTLEGITGGTIDYTKPASKTEKDAIRKRFASLKFAGRYWNPYVEWREQGAWEWAFWKLVVSSVTLKLFYNGGVPDERPIPDLPSERPNFELLFPRSLIPSKLLAKEKAPPNKDLGEDNDSVDVTDKTTITWLGQSTSYVTLDKLGILTDPALSHQPIKSFLAPHRLRPSPCRLDELKKVDLVLVSHNHFDHLDPAAVQELGDSCQWVVPTGVGAYMRGLGVTRVRELDWWEEMTHVQKGADGQEKQFTVTAIPLMHWSARSPLDTNASLWSGFHVKSSVSGSGSPKSFLHVGDTGYSPTLFAAIGRVLGPVDLAAIPIGAYEPRWHLHLQHTDPEGAVRMAMQMGVKKSIGVHWGTWLMSDEAYNQPPKDLEIARKKLLIGEDQFCVLPAGKTLVID